MSTEYHAIAYFGIDFEFLDEAEAFLHENKVLDYEEGLDGSGIGLTDLDASSGTNWIVGFKFELGDPIAKYQTMWDNLFPGSDRKPRACVDVKSF